MSNFGIAPTGSLRALPGQQRARFAPQPMIQPRPVVQPRMPMVQPQTMPMVQPQQAMPVAAPNPFAGYTQSAQQQAQGFNLNPNPTAGQGAGQMPAAKPMMPQFNPQMLPQVEPFDNSQFAQPGAAGLDPNIMFGPDAYGVVGTGRPVTNPALNPDIMFGPDAEGVVGTGRPVGGGSLFNPGSFKMK
jgi:hypothetical protein